MEDSIKPAFQGEIMLLGWRETHSGGATVTFLLPDVADLDAFRLATVKKGKTAGQLYMAVLVEIDPDDQGKPVRRPSNDAHLLLTGEMFLRYAQGCSAQPGTRDHWDSAKAREWAKWVMGVKSLSELDSDPAALVRYEQLVRRPFATWNGTRDPEDGHDDDRDGRSMDEVES